jgi:hypothetical protein
MTTKMIRKQFLIRKDQDDLLRARARELGIGPSELVRRAINTVLGRALDPEASRRAWLEIRKTIDQIANMDVPQQPRDWTHEQLYDRWERHHPQDSSGRL